MKNLLTYITKSSKLIIVYLITVIVAGSILTYLGINNISNYKELTEKRITEEEKNVIEIYRQQFQNALENLVTELNENNEGDSLLADGVDFKIDNKLVSDYLIMNEKGALIKPLFVQNIFRSNKSNTSISFSHKFQQAEHYEFVRKNYKTAEKQYLSALKFSNSKPDSAKVFNAVARLWIKIGNQKRAFENYKRIITKLNFALNEFQFPYAYFSISQLLKLTDKTLKNDIEHLLVTFLERLLNNDIPYNNSTGDLIKDILNWANQIKKNETKQLVQSLCQDINENIAFILNYEQQMRNGVSNELPEPYLQLNDFIVIINKNSNNEILLLQQSNVHSIGFIILLKNLNSVVLEKIEHRDTKFEYDIQLVDTELNGSYFNKELIIQNSFSHFFNKKEVQVKLKNPMIVEDFIFKRKLITAIGLGLLLGAMLIGLFTLIQDVNRKKRMDRMRADFVSNVTHELKTPLTSINMFADSIVLGRVQSKDQLKKYAHIIVKESERLKRMINNILDFSRTETSKIKYHLKKCDLAEIMKDIMFEMNYWLKIHKFEVSLDIEENIIALVDSEGLKQVLSNLITNAIKYSESDKKIEVHLYRKKDKAFIEVEDHGIGIPEDKLKLIFEKFYRVSSKKNENISGTGLGLTVSKDIIEAQNGKLFVESTFGKGSKFIIVLNL